MAWHDEWPHKVCASVLLLDGKIEGWKTGYPPKKDPGEFRAYWKKDRLNDYTVEYTCFEVNNDQEHNDAFEILAPEWFRQWELADDLHGSPPYPKNEAIAAPISYPERKVKFKHHFKLEFDIKTNDKDVLDLLAGISEGVKSNIELHFALHEIDVLPTVTMINDKECV